MAKRDLASVVFLGLNMIGAVVFFMHMWPGEPEMWGGATNLMMVFVFSIILAGRG